MLVKINKNSILSKANSIIEKHNSEVPTKEDFKEILDSSSNYIKSYLEDKLTEDLSSSYYSIVDIFECPLKQSYTIYGYFDKLRSEYGELISIEFLDICKKNISSILKNSDFYITKTYVSNTKYVVLTSRADKVKYLIRKKYIGWISVLLGFGFLSILARYGSEISEFYTKFLDMLVPYFSF